MTNLWLPKHLRPAHKPVAVVFYWSPKLNRILVGFPEEFPAPKGFQKIVCRTARETEIWSQKLREQDRRDQEMTDEQREAFEGPIRQYARRELMHLMANARNAVNRDFCRQALARLDEEERKRKMTRESFMHLEAAEDGH